MLLIGTASLSLVDGWASHCLLSIRGQSHLIWVVTCSFSLLPVISAHLLAPTSMLCKAPASSGGNPSHPCYYSVYCVIILAIDLCGICLMILCTADSGGICDTIMACADLARICPRTVLPTDLSELYCKSHDLPNSSIPALPSYDLTDLPVFCASRPMTLDRKATTFEDTDFMLSSIIMCSFSNKLCTEYFAEHGDQPVPIAVDLFNWAMKKCMVHSTAKEYKLLTMTYALHWDQVGKHAYNFLTKWEAHILELHAYLQDPWMPDHCYRTLKCTLPLDRNALFNSVFILHEQLNGKEQTAKSVTNMLHQCYELAAKSAPVDILTASGETELVALELSHTANHCPDDIAHGQWKHDKIKTPPKGHANMCMDMAPALAFFTDIELAPIDLLPHFVPFVFDSGASCVMVNSLRYGKDCLLVPGLVTNLIGMKLVTHAQGKVTFEDELVTVQDKHDHMIHVPTSGDGYLAVAMIIWDDSMPKPAVSLAFAATMASSGHPPPPHNKANLWHRRLGHASYESIMHTRVVTHASYESIMHTCVVTHAHDIPSSPATHSGVLCDVCVHSKAIEHNVTHPQQVEKPLELVSMDVMGPLHGNIKFAYILIIHDAFLGMIWVHGLANKGGSSQEAIWWLLESEQSRPFRRLPTVCCMTQTWMNTGGPTPHHRWLSYTINWPATHMVTLHLSNYITASNPIHIMCNVLDASPMSFSRAAQEQHGYEATLSSASIFVPVVRGHAPKT
ncbi:uncharacterized protein UHO2_00351 [Ustilago hordei]|uniref:uncharacterized protein n=1 Tax=Ustilago hordei TaxID=120017 RepID=UPI001A56E4D4|nr:uncharacterized protein UHO2_00351 [Ustilago hordei]SYW81846.1 uncharacterized protein UHO2_00351 [Ustilago hordei]